MGNKLEAGLKAINSVVKKAIKTKRSKERDYSDIRLNERKPNLSKNFLKEHGYDDHNPDLKPPSKDYFVEKPDGTVVAFNYSGKSPSGKSSFSQKTFKNPTLKSLRNWMGYSSGGEVKVISATANTSTIRKKASLKKKSQTKWESKWG